VLESALASWAHDYGTVPALFRSIFMVAADVANDLFGSGRAGTVISGAARNVVYHAADDFALRSSKVANLKNRIVQRRLGHTGPADLNHSPANVVAVDCDEFNSRYDRFGHSYLLADPSGAPGAVVRHLVETMRTGRVVGLPPGRRSLILRDGFAVPTEPANNDDSVTVSDARGVAAGDVRTIGSADKSFTLHIPT
jgi:hypothetical protein